MKAKLLSDDSLRDDLYVQLMFIAGGMANYGINGEKARDMIEKQLDLLMPVVKKHIKRRVRANKE